MLSAVSQTVAAFRWMFSDIKGALWNRGSKEILSASPKAVRAATIC
jgi:hypothetical protein